MEVVLKEQAPHQTVKKLNDMLLKIWRMKKERMPNQIIVQQEELSSLVEIEELSILPTYPKLALELYDNDTIEKMALMGIE